MVIELSPSDSDPPEGGKWVLIEEDENGEWFGTGFGSSVEGEETLYISKGDSDASYEAAISSASDWARSNHVDAIYVRRL
jgi:hypothetical protein